MAGKYLAFAKQKFRQLKRMCVEGGRRYLTRTYAHRKGNEIIEIFLEAWDEAPGSITIRARGGVFEGNLFKDGSFAMAVVNGTAFGLGNINTFNANVNVLSGSPITPVNTTAVSSASSVRVGEAPDILNPDAVDPVVQTVIRPQLALLPENAFTEDALIASYLVADPQNKALGGLSSGVTAPDGIRNTSQLRVQDPNTPSVSTLVGAIGSDLLRFGKWVVATDTPTATDLLDFTWFETSFSFLATPFSGTFVGAQDIQFSVPNIPGATFEMTLTPGSLFTNPTFLYKTGSASQAWIEHAFVGAGANLEPKFRGTLTPAGTFPNFDFNTTIISGRIVFQSKLIPASRFIRHDMEAVLGVTSPDAFNLQTASVVGSVITYTAHTYQVKQDGDIFFSKLVTERDWTSSPFTWSLISKKYSTISFDGVTGAVIETPRVVNEKTIMVSGLLDTNAAGSPWSGNVSAYELNRFSGFAGGFNRKSLVTAMTHSDFAVPGTRVFTGGVTTIDDTAASHYRRDAAATGPSSDSLRTSILQWDGVTFEVIANDTVPAITIFKEGVDLLVDNSIDINEAINTSQHNTDLRHLNAYAVGSVTETPDPPGAQFSGSWTVTYLDDELGVTLNEALAGSPAKLSIPSENSTTVFPQYTPWLDTDPNFGTNPPSILASDPVGDNDADRITAPSQFRYGDFAPLRAQSLTIFWPKLSTTRDGLCAVHRTANWVAARDAWRAEVLNPGATPSSIAIARAAMLAEHIVVYNNFVPEDLIISLEDGDYIVIDNQTIL